MIRMEFCDQCGDPDGLWQGDEFFLCRACKAEAEFESVLDAASAPVQADAGSSTAGTERAASEPISRGSRSPGTIERGNKE